MDDMILNDIEYAVTGQNGLAQANFQEIEEYVNNVLNPALIMTLDGEVMVFDGDVMVLEGW